MNMGRVMSLLAFIGGSLGATVPFKARSQPTASNGCSTDSALTQFTLARVRAVLNPSDTSGHVVQLRNAYGLNGFAARAARVVTDSTACAAAKRAYAAASFPDDSMQRARFESAIDSVLVIRLSTTRYVLNIGLQDPFSMYEMYLADSNFVVLRRSF